MIGALALGLANPAQGQDLHLDAGLTTSLPTDLGVRFAVELPPRVRLGVTAGFMPSPYLGLINGVAVGAGWYDEPTAQLIEAALKNAAILRLDAGIRPFPSRGWTADAGYMVAFLGGGLAPAETVGAAVGGDGEPVALEVGAVLHLLTVQVGHQWVVADKVVIGGNLGGAFTLTSSSTAEISGTGDAGRPGPGGGSDGVLEKATEELLDTTFRKWVHTPTLGVFVGYRFK